RSTSGRTRVGPARARVRSSTVKRARGRAPSWAMAGRVYSPARGNVQAEEAPMLNVPFRSARQLAADIRRKKIGCLELLDLYLTRVEKYDDALNAVVVRDFERARTRARAADRALARRDTWGPLHGVPMTIKESYDVAGLPTTWGVPTYKNNVATRNAVAVDRLLGAGVVIFGKTNVPLFLADWQSFNAIYGTTNNPWDVTRAPGGSACATSGWRSCSTRRGSRWTARCGIACRRSAIFSAGRRRRSILARGRPSTSTKRGPCTSGSCARRRRIARPTRSSTRTSGARARGPWATPDTTRARRARSWSL